MTEAPVGRPGTMDAPGEPFQDLHSEPIAISRRLCQVVRRPIAFDAERVSPGVLWVLNREVESIVTATNFRAYRVTCIDQRAMNRTLKSTIEGVHSTRRLDSAP